MPETLQPATARMSVPMSFIQAKLRGRRRRVYEGDRLSRLQQHRSVRRVWEELYPRAQATGWVALERRLREDRIAELASFIHLLPPGVADFYNALLLRFQIDNILVLMRLFAGGREAVQPEEFVPELPDELQLPSGELLSLPSLKAFVAALPPALEREAAPTISLYEEHETIAFTEMALERAWWLGICRELNNLPRTHRPQCAAPLISELASARVLAVLRAGRNYNIDWEDLQPQLPPVGPRPKEGPDPPLSDKSLRDLFEKPSPANIAATVPRADKDVAQSLIDLEERMWEATYRIANRIYYRVMEGPSIVVSYFYVRRNELKNLIKTVESIHYGR
jgi:vacuolar-type H+-ATPase subunit C/Vma6